jgi:hypothetical protein
MVRVAITVEAFEAICASMPLGSVLYEPEVNAKGEPTGCAPSPTDAQ